MNKAGRLECCEALRIEDVKIRSWEGAQSSKLKAQIKGNGHSEGERLKGH